jgi:hypothetical protein
MIGHHAHRALPVGGQVFEARQRIKERNRHGQERIAAKQVSFSVDRRENQGARRLARQDCFSRLRTLIKQADPDVVEEWKWRGRSGVVA